MQGSIRMTRSTIHTRFARLGIALGMLAALALTPAASASAAGICITIVCANGPRVTDLDTGSTLVTYPAAINNNAKVVGRALGPSFVHAFSWQAGSLKDLGTLATDAVRNSMGIGLNQAGDVVGFSETNGDLADSAFLFRSGVMSLVYRNGSASAINSSSQIAGYTKDAAGLNHAAVFQNGIAQPASSIPTCPYSEGNGINDSGTMAITAVCNGFTHFRALTWRNGVLTDLGAPFNGDSYANGINGAGQVVGDWSESGFHRGALFSGGVVYSLNPLPGHPSAHAAAINSTGRVVGYSQDSAGKQHAVIWQSGGAVQDLTAQLAAGSGWILETATGINDAGQIVGEGLHNGVEHGYLFTPAQQPVVCC
jgi:probable HAF family extracellular repeat protein